MRDEDTQKNMKARSENMAEDVAKDTAKETPDSGAISSPHTPPIRDTALLELLVCPVTLGPLRYDTQKNELISDKASLAFPIRSGIPIMLADEAREL